ncbi:Endodeoxyribonuclease RusA [Sporotomaculum syntrophicum]|uniref:Endodeoxyribonuclease RusA n=1 Tax=Sporotomaculum syntrophicum TaxID=182264 RepID=A0A9D2WS97_9FIRM|nr:RusA family crossover junction endodeoxyribonuclease [Sporotomaculum syntrophicum]KAF1086163.1 Endodeoxyribonuclease RusA [Sporotomaculum syntrophicum]
MVSFVIPGRPVPKQRPRAGKNGRIYTPKKSRDYEKTVGWAGKQVFKYPYNGPVSLQVKVYLTDSRSQGDLDNYIKSIQDGLNNIAWRDDRQVVRLKAGLYVRPGAKERVEVMIQRL